MPISTPTSESEVLSLIAEADQWEAASRAGTLEEAQAARLFPSWEPYGMIAGENNPSTEKKGETSEQTQTNSILRRKEVQGAL